MALVSRRAYAAKRGVSEGAVRKAIAAGKIALVNGMIDPALADAAWARNRDGGQQSKLAEAILASTPAPAQLPLEAEIVRASDLPGDEPAARKSEAELATAPLTQARILNTRESTAIKAITRRKLEGELIESEEVDRTWGEMLQVLKDRLRMIPDDDELVAALLKCRESAEIRSLLTRGVMSTLAAMTKGIEGMVA